MKTYSVIRNYKKFKKDYPSFVLFIKGGDYYYTFDSDAKIMMYVYENAHEKIEYKIEKNKFASVQARLHSLGLNVALAGWKLSSEYYTDKMSEYQKLKKKAKAYYNATLSSVNDTMK